jgi:hypothetical protein
MKAYLQHGKAGEPMATESVPVKESPLYAHIHNLSYTASGYGSRIPTAYMVQVGNRWRRVYCAIYSNNGTLYIGRDIKTGIVVNIDR